jgi:cell division protein FtsW (lipid II flippase)
MRTEEVDDASSTAAFGLAGGCAAAVVAALAAAAFMPPGHLGARMLVMAVTVGILAAVLTDWRACAGVAVVAALIFVGFLAHRDGVLTGDTRAWPYTIIIGVAAVLGRGRRWMRHAALREDDSIPDFYREDVAPHS